MSFTTHFNIQESFLIFLCAYNDSKILYHIYKKNIIFVILLEVNPFIKDLTKKRKIAAVIFFQRSFFRLTPIQIYYSIAIYTLFKHINKHLTGFLKIWHNI